MKLNNLHIANFRGATKPVTIEFNPNKNITMIFGENGNGKTTICDALICLLTDQIGSLDDKSSTINSLIKSIDTDEEAIIRLSTDVKTYEAKIPKFSSSIRKPLNIQYPNIFSLRRKQVINLVEAQPAQRYNALKDFVDIDNIIASEEELRELIRDLTRENENRLSQIQNSESVLETTWKQIGSPQNDYLSWAESQSKIDINKIKIQIDKIKSILRMWISIEDSYNELFIDYTEREKIKKDIEIEQEKLKSIEINYQNQSTSLINLLRNARDYVKTAEVIELCPVCNNEIEKGNLIHTLDHQINSMQELRIQYDLCAQLSKEVDQVNNIVSKVEIQLNTFLISFEPILQPYKSKYPQIDNFISQISDDIDQNIACLNSNFDALKNFVSMAEDANLAKSKELDQLIPIKDSYNNIIENRAKFERLEKLKTKANQALEFVESIRKEFYESELASISDEVDRMYQIIHPEEGIGHIQLSLNPKRRGSLDLQADFHSSSNITPQSVYSESHLDTLGICIFLGLAKKYSNGDSILILDDLVNSVDENHLDRFIELLHQETEHFSQIILTTHYRPWRDRYFYNRAPGGHVHFLELRDWSKENGVRIYRNTEVLDELKNRISDPEKFNRSIIATESGRILENILDFLAVKYVCRLPRKLKNDFTLRELLDSFPKKLLKNMYCEQLRDINGKLTSISTVQLEPFINRLKELSLIRNMVGAHFNLEGSMVSNQDVEEFGRLTLSFSEALTCPESGSFPNRNTSGSYWESKSGRIRLYPLGQPE